MRPDRWGGDVVAAMLFSPVQFSARMIAVDIWRPHPRPARVDPRAAEA
ncbi:MAG TPA: hypothetical protein VHX38_16125 [Pseudonocardiaceae bacterium]|nr:hypothetical protein [Pseudonocardiaceae bacterium]